MLIFTRTTLWWRFQKYKHNLFFIWDFVCIIFQTTGLTLGVEGLLSINKPWFSSPAPSFTSVQAVWRHYEIHSNIHNNYFFTLVFTGVNASTKHAAAEKQVRLVFTCRTKRNYSSENGLVMYYTVVMCAATMGESCPLLQIWHTREPFWNILVWSQ